MNKFNRFNYGIQLGIEILTLAFHFRKRPSLKPNRRFLQTTLINSVRANRRAEREAAPGLANGRSDSKNESSRRTAHCASDSRKRSPISNHDTRSNSSYQSSKKIKKS